MNPARLRPLLGGDDAEDGVWLLTYHTERRAELAAGRVDDDEKEEVDVIQRALLQQVRSQYYEFAKDPDGVRGHVVISVVPKDAPERADWFRFCQYDMETRAASLAER